MKAYLRLTANILLLLALIGAVIARSEYKVTKSDKSLSTVTLHLQYTGTEEFYKKETSPISKELVFVFHMHMFYDFYVKIYDPTQKRFEVPQYSPWPVDPLANFSYPINLAGVTFEYTQQPFDFRITRKINNAVIFDSHNTDFVFSEHYMKIGTQVDTKYIYGLGERFQNNFRKTAGKWTIFSRDRGMVIDQGKGLQTYGYYPVFFAKERAQHFHFNYLRNSNAMDAVIEEKQGQTYITWHVIGGIFDFRFLLSETNPQIALEKWNIFIGASAVPPFWSLGYHQCRWGYKNINDLKNVLKGHQQNGIPLDTIWSDIDYMVDYEDFTIDETRFPLNQMKEILEKYHYIPIVDAGIKVNDGIAYNQGVKRGVFVKTAKGQEYRGKVWPGKTTFVDFLHPNATEYWMNMLDILYNKVGFSGVWLDMNQYANFGAGTTEFTPVEQGGFDFSKDLPYQPGSDNIESHTISLNCTHYQNVSESDVHVFGSMLETHATNKFLASKDKRPFIITRATTLGSHKYGFHWTGDNRAEWKYLKGSIADNFNFNFWGIQMVGPDICGFGGNTTEELCSRWFQVATLYPFTRNHNDHNEKSQQAYALGDNVLIAAKNALKLRYSLLKHYYTLFISKRGLGSIFKPMFFEFPSDEKCYDDEIVNTQFLVGLNLLATPILQEGATGRDIYLPGHNWYDFHTGKHYVNGTHTLSDVKITDKVPIFLRAGGAVLIQNTENVLQTRDLGNMYQLVAGFTADEKHSTQDIKYYNSVAGHMSIRDYNDNTKINACLSQGCEYLFRMILTVSAASKTLEIDINYSGGVALNQLLIIDKVSLYYGEQVIINDLTTPVEISGSNKIIIPIGEKDE